MIVKKATQSYGQQVRGETHRVVSAEDAVNEDGDDDTSWLHGLRRGLYRCIILFRRAVRVRARARALSPLACVPDHRSQCLLVFVSGVLGS